MTGEPDVQRRAGQRWWRKPWVMPLAILVIAFIAFSLPRYLSLDPAQSRVPATFSGHYPLLVAHVVFGAVAMVASVPQVWPWFRARYRKAHKVIGRVYVYGGVLPAGLTGLVVGATSPFGPVARVNNVLLALLWLGFTITAVRRARQRRFGEHRKWMIRSFALTFSIVVSRIVSTIAAIILTPQLDTMFGGDPAALSAAVGGISTSLSLPLVLLFTQWWLERRRR